MSSVQSSVAKVPSGRRRDLCIFGTLSFQGVFHAVEPFPWEAITHKALHLAFHHILIASLPPSIGRPLRWSPAVFWRGRPSIWVCFVRMASSLAARALAV